MRRPVMNLYSHEKVRELEERLSEHWISDAERPSHRPRIFGLLARNVGSTLRRLGEGLESWSGSPRTTSDDSPISFGKG